MRIKTLLNRLTLLRGIVKSDDLIRHGSIMVAFALSVAFLNYLYQFFMSILLTPAQYGTFFSLTSILAIVVSLSRTLQISIAKFTSKFQTQEQWGKINYLWRYSLKYTFLIGLGVFLVLALLTPLIARFLNIDNYWYPVILFSAFILVFTLPASRGVLHGLQRFWRLGCSNVLWAVTKLGIGVLLVYLGLGLYGSLVSFSIAYVITFVITLIFIRDISRVSNEKFDTGPLFSYSGLTFIALLSFAVLTEIDVVLAKHYLSPEIAGNYSAVALLGRVALFAPAGIVVAMFPKTSGLFEAGGETRPMLRKALLSVLLIAGSVVIVYWLFSGFIVNLLYGDKYPFVAPYLVRYGAAMALFAISFLLMNYWLSLNQTRIAYCFLGAMLLELGLIAFFHSSIAQVVDMMLISGAACLTLVLLYYLCYARRKIVR